MDGVKSWHSRWMGLSNNIVSKYTNVVIAAPISTTLRRLPLYLELPDGLTTKGTVLLDQLVSFKSPVVVF